MTTLRRTEDDDSRAEVPLGLGHAAMRLDDEADGARA